MNGGVDRLFVGVGVSEYAGSRNLPRAAEDVAAVRKQLRFAQLDPLTSPTWLEAIQLLDSIENHLPDGGLVVFMWSGHGFLDAGLRLLTHDDDKKADGLAFAEAVRPVARSGAHQLLFIVDVCYSGEALSTSAVIDELLRNRPPEHEAVWFGVLTSCLEYETAKDGYFGKRLLALLMDGPSDPLAWPSTSEFISGEELGNALKREWPHEASQRPRFRKDGAALPVIPNPKFRPGPVVPTIVEHLLQSARGGASITEASAFTGRVPEVNTVVDWVGCGRPGVHVITGPPGTGKSAILGRVVSWSDPQERAQLLSEGASRTHNDPGEGSVTASVHARGLTVDQVAEQLDEALVGAGLLTRREKSRNAAQVLGDLQAARESSTGLPVLAIDGVDEAGTEAFAIARELLVPLGRWATVAIATRELRSGDESLLDLLDPNSTRLDLGTRESAARGQDDIREYVRHRLTGVDDSMDPALVADLVAERATPDEMPFLLARLVTSQLRNRPVDTSHQGWADAVASSLTDALLADITAVAPPPHRPSIDAAVFARRLLVALTWAFGAGFPLTEWAIVADVVTVPSDNSTADTDEPTASVASTTPEDLWWVLEQLGRYLVQDAEARETVYRLAHRGLADALRSPWTPTADQPFDPDAAVVAQALVNRYQVLLEGGIPASEPRYLWMHLWRHTATAGPQGVDALRDLATRDDDLQPDLANASLYVAAVCRNVDRRQDALTSTREAVTIRRTLAGTNPAFLPDLTGALNDLGTCYGELGRHNEALAPTEEAATTLQDLAKQNPALWPDLARALTNLGVNYSNLGRHHEALALIERAATTLQDLAKENPALRPDLARALTNLGVNYSNLDHHHQALAPTKEAVTIYRDLCKTNTAFPTTLQDLAKQNPALRPDLARALTNLGVYYSNLSRHHEALAPTEEAATTLQDLAKENPALRPDLANALNNLGVNYSELGRHHEALAPTDEAAAIYRDLAETNTAFLPDLARALNNLSDHYRAVGKDPELPWSVTLDGTTGIYRATLIAHRVANSQASLESVVAWVADGLSHTENPGLIRALHDLARRHRQTDSTRFDTCWVNVAGDPAPGWLTVEPALLKTADAWLAAPTETDERDHCAAHPELLDQTADAAVDEALLLVSTADAERYRHIRDTARTDGVDAAYRPILLHEFAVDFASADLTTKRHLLTSRRQDLLTTEVNAALVKLNTGDDPLSLIAAPLLALARIDADTQVLDAIEHPDQFPDLLHQTATAAEPTALLPTAACAFAATDTEAEAALALFYAAVAHVLANANEDAAATLGQARSLDPDQVTTWLFLLTSITAAHPEAAALAPLLA